MIPATWNWERDEPLAGVIVIRLGGIAGQTLGERRDVLLITMDGRSREHRRAGGRSRR